MSSNQDRSIFGIDVVLIIATLALIVIGVLFIYSSGVTSTGESFSREWIRQIIWAGVGLAILVAVSTLDYTRLKDVAPYLYLGLVATLIGTLLFGRVVNGARSWIGIGNLGVQPSEFMKVATILVLARICDERKQLLSTVPGFLLAMLVVLVPMGLVLMQPDLGTALVYLPVFLITAYVAGAKTSHVLFVVLSGLLTIVLTVLPAWEYHIVGREIAALAVLREPRITAIVLGAITIVTMLSIAGLLLIKRAYFMWLSYGSLIGLTGFLGSFVGRRVLQDYQIMRLIVFLDPNIDPRGAGWNIIQSVTAVGSGGIAGKGWLRGTQSHLQYLPQQSTDFIFSILAEEWGFLGALFVFLCFTAIVARGLIIASKAKDNYAALVAVGIVTMIFFHVAVNVGMAIGIMPITGIPLLFLSYGGSSLWTALVSIGILMSIYQRRFRY